METQVEKPAQKSNREENTNVILDRNGIISVYNTHTEAEAAVKQLQRSGFDMKKLSIVGRDYQSEENIIGYYNMGERTKYWGKLGAFWGGLWGLLFGSALFLVPGVGPIIVAGTFVSTLVGAIEGAVIVGGASALGAALFSIGIKKDSIIKYETDLKAGKYLMIAHGTIEDLKKAREIAKSTGGSEIADFDSNDVAKTSTTRH